MKLTVAAGILSILAVAGCATSSKTYGPDGNAAHTINCSGVALNWGMCLSRAGEICETRGYDILFATTDRGTIVNATPQLLFGSTTISRSMLIQCK